MNTLYELPSARKAFEKANLAQKKMADNFERALPRYMDDLNDNVNDSIEHGVFSVCCELDFLNETHRNKFITYVRDNFGYNVTIPTHQIPHVNLKKVITVSWEHF